MKFCENPSSGPRDDSCGQEDLRKLTYVFANVLRYALCFTAAFLTISPQSRECDLVSRMKFYVWKLDEAVHAFQHTQIFP
jgi:hypothetical protein